MESPAQSVAYPELAATADQILDECGEDIALLSIKLDGLPIPVRDDLLVSDLLNAYQVFYYFFKESPGDLPMERLILSPASALLEGLFVDEIEFLELIFAIVDHRPVIVVSDGERAIATFLGIDAYKDGLMYIESIL
jgi:hypothetical protein